MRWKKTVNGMNLEEEQWVDKTQEEEDKAWKEVTEDMRKRQAN